ncbi:MAG: hypothetical protein HRU25_01445 [Psychrobium sp.]|nr:hypothetical protein [Psychrobium sp.]
MQRSAAWLVAMAVPVPDQPCESVAVQRRKNKRKSKEVSRAWQTAMAVSVPDQPCEWIALTASATGALE